MYIGSQAIKHLVVPWGEKKRRCFAMQMLSLKLRREFHLQVSRVKLLQRKRERERVSLRRGHRRQYYTGCLLSLCFSYWVLCKEMFNRPRLTVGLFCWDSPTVTHGGFILSRFPDRDLRLLYFIEIPRSWLTAALLYQDSPTVTHGCFILLRFPDRDSRLLCFIKIPRP